MAQELTKEIAYKALQKIFEQTPLVVFGTGTSCALDPRFGMNELKTHLLCDIGNYVLNENQQEQWNCVIEELNHNDDLEKAMDKVQDEQLIKYIVESSSKFIGAVDKEYSEKIRNGSVRWPAINLFNRLVDGLPPNSRILHVTTTNYDLIAEYAFEKAGLLYTTGFYGNNYNWDMAENQFRYFEDKLDRGKHNKVCRTYKHINIYKVHGSLDTFISGNYIYKYSEYKYDVPPGYERLMITPGMSKYQRLHKYRSELLSRHDRAVEQQNSFLFIGFGFNDNQLTNNALDKKLRVQKCPGLILTRDYNNRIDEYIRKCENLWIVCKRQEVGNNGTRIYNVKYQDWLIIDDKQLWRTDVFSNEILGG